jgi:hypothetical protein
MRTHCRNGHDLLNEQDVYRRPNGDTECKICSRNRDKARYPARRQEVIDRATQWYKDNPEKLKAVQRKQEQRPEVKKRRKEFYEKTKSHSWRKFSMLQSIARRIGRDFSITQTDYELLIYNKPCFYCGGSLPEVGYGTDRQDNKLGYTTANIVPCCETCNEKKGSLEGLGFKYPRTVELLREILEAPHV